MRTDTPEAFERGDGLFATLLTKGESINLPDHWVEHFRTRGNRHKRSLKTESPTSIIKYSQCPLSWFAERHSPENGGGVFVPNAFSVLGTYVHRVLELFYDVKPARLRTPELLNQIRNEVWAGLRDGDVRGGITPVSMIDDFNYAVSNPVGSFTPQKVRAYIQEKGDECIGRLFEIDEDPSASEVTRGGLEKWSRSKWGDITCFGKIDMVLEGDAGGRVIVDHKTGKLDLPDDWESTFDDLETFKSGMYAAVEGEDVDWIEQWYLKEGALLAVRVTPERVDFVRDVVSEVTRQMREIESSGVIRVSPAESQSSGLCKYCPIRSVCPAWNPESSLVDVADFLRRAAKK